MLFQTIIIDEEYYDALIDTGSTMSIINHHMCDKINIDYTCKTHKLVFRFKETSNDYSIDVEVLDYEDVNKLGYMCIFGMDFIMKYQCMIDIKSITLYDPLKLDIHKSSRLYINQPCNGIMTKFMIDTGSNTNVMSIDTVKRCNLMQSLREYDDILKGFNITRVIGKIENVDITIGDTHTIDTFFVVEKCDNIIGSIFLFNNNCIIEHTKRRINLNGIDTKLQIKDIKIKVIDIV